MTLLAQEGRASLQQIGCGCSVRVVADSAILGNRLMIVDEGAALFHVARIAGLVDAASGKLLLTRRSMRAMTIGTAHLSFANRVVTWLAHLRPLFLVAGVANFRLRLLVANSVLAAMDFMAVRTNHIARCVSAGRPERFVATLVACSASIVACLGAGWSVLAEAAVHLWRLVAPLVQSMLFAFAVAIDAGRRALVGRGAVLGLANGEDTRIQFQHRGRPDRLIRLVVATGTFRITFEDQVLGIRIGRKVGFSGRGLGVGGRQ